MCIRNPKNSQELWRQFEWKVPVGYGWKDFINWKWKDPKATNTASTTGTESYGLQTESYALCGYMEPNPNPNP